MDDVYQHILARYEVIREADYELTVQWECKWQNFKEECEYMRAFEQGLRIVLRLEPRDAFTVEEQKPFNCMPIQKKMKKYVTLISRLFTHLSIRTAAILLGTLASSPNLHPPTFPLTLVW